MNKRIFERNKKLREQTATYRVSDTDFSKTYKIKLFCSGSPNNIPRNKIERKNYCITTI